jgi:hypothetical protein
LVVDRWSGINGMIVDRFCVIFWNFRRLKLTLILGLSRFGFQEV